MRAHVYTFNHPTRFRWLRGVVWTGAAGALVAAGAAAVRFPGAARLAMMKVGLARPRTIESAVKDFGEKAEAKFAATCRAHHIPYPPPRVRLLAFKEEKRLEVWVAGRKGGFVSAATYPILAASGGPGPKRREGDQQVPEGFYRLGELNPNSTFHLSVKVEYPNADDVAHRVVDESKMGGDIMLHGGANSVGCLAIGDDAIEEVWTLVAQVPEAGREIWIAPMDFRAKPKLTDKDPWVIALYQKLTTRMLEEHPVR